MQRKAHFFIITAASLWGLIGLFVKILAAQGFSPMQIVALRAAAASSCITIVVWRIGLHYLKISWRDLWLFIGTGVISLTFFNYCYFNCIKASSLSAAALLLYTAPIFVMLFSLCIFKEKFTSAKGCALLATFGGCALVAGVTENHLAVSLPALGYGLGSGVGYALYSIFGKLAVRKYHTLTVTAYTFYFSLLSAAPLADFSSNVNLLEPTALLASLAIGGLCAVIPYLLYTRGLKEAEAGQASILATAEPMVAAGIGIAVFGEALTAAKFCGMLLIFSSIVILNLPAMRQRAK